jgi:hypothetical protein
VYLGFGSSTPLWYYILAEAKAASGGTNLGPIAGRIVTETLIGLLRADPTSYLSANRAGLRSSAPISSSAPTSTRTSPETGPTPGRISSTTPRW